MFNVELKSLAALESHRGVGYLAFLAAIIAPTLLAHYLLAPHATQQNVALTLLVACCVGLTVTCWMAVGVFTIFARPESETRQHRKAGAGALLFGAMFSLMLQTGVLFYVVFSLKSFTFKVYVLSTLGWGLLIFLLLLSASMIVDLVRSAGRRRKARGDA